MGCGARCRRGRAWLVGPCHGRELLEDGLLLLRGGVRIDIVAWLQAAGEFYSRGSQPEVRPNVSEAVQGSHGLWHASCGTGGVLQG